MQPSRIHSLRLLALTPALLLSIAIGGCATAPQPSDAERSAASTAIPVARHGRYTLIEIAPAVGQRDLLQQVIATKVPPEPEATVGDGLRAALARSGYRLCDEPGDTRQLETLPLPAPHYALGPLPLREALQTLAGKEWTLQVDERNRRVCFARRVAGKQGTSTPNRSPCTSPRPARSTQSRP